MPASKHAGADADETQAVEPANVIAQPGVVARRGELERKLLAQAEVVREDDADPYERILKQVLSAESADVVLTPTEVTQARDIVGVPIVVIAFELNESEFDAGSPFYATITAILEPNGAPMPVNCGHRKVLAQLVRLQELDSFPIACQFIERGKSKIGGTPMLELTKWTDEQQAALAQPDSAPF
jgi:hypothetical protein